MCTVTLVRSGSKIIITSNRDEQVSRPAAYSPDLYLVNGQNVLFPKDPLAGGTWFAVSYNGAIGVVLNGAGETHAMRKGYRRSRGLILLDVLTASSPLYQWQQIDLDNIEPFTLILHQNDVFYQLRWNEIEKETVELDPSESYIWSSTPLYPKDVRAKRAVWFADLLAKKAVTSEGELFDFHLYTAPEDIENGLIINRGDFLKTRSITQCVVENGTVTMRYYDLETLQESEKVMQLLQ